jgi:hypothetical protein
MDIREERLFETEWPGRTVVVLEASLDTSDRGRGMNSIVSENPTRVRVDGRAGKSIVAGTALMSSECVDVVSLTPTAPGEGNANCSWSRAEGVVGALPPLIIMLEVGGLMIIERSWEEIAADRRC